MKSSKRIKRNILIAGIVFVLLWNVIWAANYLKYRQKGEGYENYQNKFSNVKDGYSYTVKCPDLFSFTGNYAVTNEDNTITLIVWPKLFLKGAFEEYKMGLQIYDNEMSHGYMFYIDSNLAYIRNENNPFTPEEEETIERLLEKRQEGLREIYQLARNEFGE